MVRIFNSFVELTRNTQEYTK